MVDPATERIRTRSVRTIALLGLLVARTGSPQSRATIAGVFWPESGDAQALTNLRRELHQLRRILGEDDESLEVTSSQLCWHDTGRHRVDLGTFLRERRAALDATRAEDEIEHGLTALEQYAGDLLPGLDDEWLDGARAELRQMCVHLCDAVSAAALRSGRPRVAMEAMRKRILIDPYDEEAYRTLMELQAGRGDRAGAIRTYHRLATALELDLGVTPDPETAAALTRIMGPGPTFGPLGTADAARSGPTRADLVGRTAELDRLLETWRRATTGRAEVVVVYGGAGVGKTRLVSELESHARQQGAVVAVTRCFDSTGRLSLSPVADWLREPTISAARTRLEPPWRVEADRLVPLAAEGPGRAAEVRVDVQETHDVWQRHRFFEGVARALLVGHRPTLLVLDNVQWCDQDTLSFTAFLMNLAPEAPLLLAVTARPDPDEVNPATGPWLSLLRESNVLSEVTLAPLDADQTATLAGSVTGQVPTGADAALMHDATGGLPLFVVEAARTAVTEGRSGTATDWSDILRRRLLQTSPAARETAGLAAALGRDFSLSLLVEASDLEADTVVVAVDELWRHRIVREFQDGYDFSHDLLRDAAYAMVSPPRRWLLHRRLAQALELMQAGGSDAVAAQLAEQYRLAGNRERALVYYLQAADATASVFAHAEALSLLDSARALLETVPEGRDRDEREMRCLEVTGPIMLALHGYSYPRLEQISARTIELADRLGRPEQRVTAMVALWSSVFVRGGMKECFDIASQAVARVRPGEQRFGQAHFSLAGSALHLGLPRLAFEHFGVAHDSMSDESLSLGTRARVHTAAWWAHAAWGCGMPERAAELAAAAVEEGRASGHQYSYVVSLAYAAITHQLLGDETACVETAVELHTLCDRYQFSYYGEWGRILEGWCSGGSRGADLIENGIRTLERNGALARMPYWLSLQADTTPDADRSAALIERALEYAASTGEDWCLPVAGRPATRRGRPAVPTRQSAQSGRSDSRSDGPALTANARRTPCFLAWPAPPRDPWEGPMTATTSRVETSSTPYDELAGSIRGELIAPDHADYDEARKVYNAMIDRRPAAIVRCWDVADVRACVRFATEHGVEIAVRGGGHNANGLGVWDNALVIDLSPMHSTTVSPDHGHGPGRRRLHVGRRRPRDGRVRAGHPVGNRQHHRRRRALPRRRHRLPGPEVRPVRRQPRLGRRGPRRRQPRDGQRDLASRPLLGAPWRRRQLRRGHLVRVPLPPRRRERHDHRGPGALRHGGHRRGPAVVPRPAALAAG